MHEAFGANLIRLRRRLGWSQTALAHSVGVSRQTIIALEQGDRDPHLGLAVALAQQLHVTLDELVRDGSVTAAVSPRLWVGGIPPAYPTPVVWSRVHGQLVVAPWADLAQPTVIDGWWDPRSASLLPTPQARNPERVIFVGGCDPFLSYLKTQFEALHPQFQLEALPLSSLGALEALRQGSLHVAGTHLYDPVSRQYNHVSEAFPFPICRLPYLKWQEGLIHAADTTVAPQQWAIREPGSEAAALWQRRRPSNADSALVLTFPRHTTLVEYVASHPDAAGVSIGALATLRGLEFSPWADEAYDWLYPASDRNTRWISDLEALRGSEGLEQFFSALAFITLARD